MIDRDHRGSLPRVNLSLKLSSLLALGFLLFGEGNVPWMVRELIRLAEPVPEKRPAVIIG